MDIKNVKIKDSFWSKRREQIMQTVLPYQEAILNDLVEGVDKSHALANFRIAAGLEEGEFYGMVFQDSDVAKWLEGAAWALAAGGDRELEARVDSIVDLVEKAQQSDGYLNTYFTVKEPERRWQNLQECHELYCAGHMMEAAAALFEATGKEKLLKVAERMAENIIDIFVKGGKEGVPGHQEIELGLLRLYEVTGKEAYRDLAFEFIARRGKNPEIFEKERSERGWIHFDPIMDPKNHDYAQVWTSADEQREARGHCVRACYMYTAMAQLAKIRQDAKLEAALDAIWEDITQRKMYVTGAIGATAEGEAFSAPYDLPGDMAYAETCAAIALIFFARRMLDIEASNRYADVMELALYNAVLSGIQLDGKKFFYVNPLTVEPGISGTVFGYKHVLPERTGWYTCACCPPNLVRLIMSLGKYAWGFEGNTVYSHLAIGGSAEFDCACIECESELPWQGRVSYIVHPKENEKFTFALRIPGYAENARISINGEEVFPCVKSGYSYIERCWREGDRAELCFDMEPQRIYTSTLVRENAGMVALRRGSIIYCLENADNGERLQELMLPRAAKLSAKLIEEGPLALMYSVEAEGIRQSGTCTLYGTEPPKEERAIIKAVPYFAWGNRGAGQMQVFIRERF